MALQTLQGALWVPPPALGAIGQYAVNNLPAMDATGKKVAFLFTVPKAGTINQIGFKTGTVTTGDTIKVGLQTVDTSTGNPSGTAYGGSSTVTQVINSTDDNVFFTVTLGTGATAVQGDLVAVVIEWNSYVAGSMIFISVSGNIAGGGFNYPYCVTYNASVWAKSPYPPLLYIKYSDNSVAYIPGCYPYSATANQTFTSATSPDEYGMKFKLPFPFTLSGLCVLLHTSQQQDLDFKLYDSNGSTVLKTKNWKGPVCDSTSTRQMIIMFDSTQNLLANTFYRLTLVPTGNTNSEQVNIFTVPEAVAMDQIEGGQNFHLTSRTDAGAWTDTTTQRMWMSLLISALDDATGGLLVNRGMSGGVI